jgi:hypothetical protein
MSQQALSHKQGGYLFRLTGLKFWEPENRPEPTISQAGEIIDACLTFLKEGRTEEQRAAAVRLVRPFFPDWDGQSIRQPFYAKKKSTGHDNQQELPLPEEKPAEDKAPAPKAKRQPAPTPEHDEQHEEHHDEPEHEEAPKAPKAKPAPATSGAPADLRAIIGAGLRNIWLYGPAGTGKTTICRQLAEEANLPCTILSCSAGTSPAEITGFKYPEPRASAISRAIAQPGIIVLDEMPMLEPDVAAVCNALLANNELETSTGHVIRNPDCIIIATANTTGTGADRQYIGNNQLDAATLDRFAGAFVKVDYSAEYESQFDPQVVAFCQALRSTVKINGIDRIISTRAIIAADKLKAAGLDWKAGIIGHWTDDEKALCF